MFSKLGAIQGGVQLFSHGGSVAQCKNQYTTYTLTLNELILGGDAMDNRDISLLFVDDEASILSAIKRQFRPLHYQIYTAENGEDALKLLKYQKIDIIISDQRMPHMSGLQLLTQVKLNYPATRRIILSGYTDLQEILSAINDGNIQKFVTKPWDQNKLQENIEELAHTCRYEIENASLAKKLDQANQRLVETNLRLSTKNIEDMNGIMNMIPVPLICINQYGAILSANRACEAYGQILPQVGHTLNMCLPESLAKQILECIGLVISTNEPQEISDHAHGWQAKVSKVPDQDFFVAALHFLQ